MATESEDVNWQIVCDNEVFEKCKGEKKFPYIVTLARAVNALNSTHSALMHAGTENTPAARRDRLNSYFFASAILYESLRLIRAMNQTFRHDDVFQKGLHTLLKDKTAKQIEKLHLDPARNGAVFHFLPDRFAKTINSATSFECEFIAGRGRKKKQVYYPFADAITAEILVGFAADTEKFYETLGAAMTKTRDLVIRLGREADHLIAYWLKEWGFKALMGGVEGTERGTLIQPCTFTNFSTLNMDLRVWSKRD